MSTPADDELDRRLARPRALSGEPVDDGILLAYLAGTLDPSAIEEVDAALAQSSVARAQLRALANARRQLTDADFASAEGALPSQRRRWPIWAGAGLAIAAALLIWVMRPITPEVAWRLDGPRGGVQAARAEKIASRIFLPQSELTVDLVPDGSVEPQAVKVYVVGLDAVLRARPVATTRSPAGAVQIRATAKALFDEGYGARTLWVVIGDGTDLEGVRAEAADQRAGATFPVEVDYRAALTPDR